MDRKAVSQVYTRWGKHPRDLFADTMIFGDDPQQKTSHATQLAHDLKNSTHDYYLHLQQMEKLASEGLKAIDGLLACLKHLHKPTYH
jgi:hypothetical protein